MSTPNGHIAIVRIERNDEVSVDWHLTRFGEHWISRAEARCGALGYAVKPIDHGVLGAAEARGTPAA
ncbi:hypothetical protein [Burkholderia sp. MSMB0856]|uniref:hypothetical protein n=1 Tax=Burkholderia sp. MSMB0856 TaxID=1637869 RepID=UPI001F27B1AD|nr:hypothetical protein [Burkholderia sp. MSMB0856]